jgi:putative DNA primase/helicase
MRRCTSRGNEVVEEALPSEVADKLWSILRAVHGAPPSEKLATLENCARHAAGLIGSDLSRAQVVDRLQTLAEADGIVAGHGNDAVVAAIAAGLENPVLLDDQIDEDEPRPPEFSDDALALLFAKEHGFFFRYVDAWGRWLQWDGRRWHFDETRAVWKKARHLCRAVAKACGSPKLAKSIASAKTIAAVVNLARCDSLIAARIDDFDAHPWLLNTPAGVIDLRTGARRAHDQLDYLTKITTVSPDKACDLTAWLKFLDRVCAGDQQLIAFLKRMLGYGLTGLIREHALFFFYGKGANGKSTFLAAVTGCMGDYHRTAPIETFTVSGGDRHPTEVAALKGARLVTSVETEEGRRWAEAKIKSITGGDKIAARFMRQDFFEYLPVFKLVIAGNHMPSLRSVDEAIRRRFHLIPFTVTVPVEERDKQLGEKLQNEYPAILAWMVEGCLEWQSRGLDPPPSVVSATATYLKGEDAIGAWIERAGDHDANAFELTAALYGAWKKHATRAGEFIGSERKFSQWLEDRSESLGLRKGRDSKGLHGFYGLRLAALTADEPDQRTVDG